MKKDIKQKLIAFLIVSLSLNANITFAKGTWVDTALGKQYIDENGKFAVGWRWLDDNNSSIMQCYRFSQEGVLLTNATDSTGKRTNEYGQWINDGIVQQIYATNLKPLASNGKTSAPTAERGTTSTLKINATGWDVYDGVKSKETDEKLVIPKGTTTTKKTTKGKTVARQTGRGGDPRSTFTPNENGYIVGGKANINKAVPDAVFTPNGKVLDTTVEDEVKVFEEGEKIIAGTDMTRMVTTSNKFTKTVKNVKIWGGDTWEEAMQLSGNGASVKFNLRKSDGSPCNWFRMEVAHQTHGESTSDTYAVLELYMGGVLVSSYDSFNDAEPEVIEEWNDDDTSIELKLVVTGDAPGRKVYIRNAKARTIKEASDKF